MSTPVNKLALTSIFHHLDTQLYTNLLKLRVVTKCIYLVDVTELN
jgi:hypothetical protein